MFLQIHTLTSYNGALLNRDDVGAAKQIRIGGTHRTRISSQCLKYHWRNHDGPHALSKIDGVERSVRSREIFGRCVERVLIQEDGRPADVARVATLALMEAIFDPKARAARARGKRGHKKEKDGSLKLELPGDIKTGQVLVFGRPEIRYFLDVAREATTLHGRLPEVAQAIAARLDTTDSRRNLAALIGGAGLDAALFGRMVTGDVLARSDAAVHVAHAFTVHAEEAESDYFSAVDDLLRESGDTASGHIGNAELTSGLFYGYVVIDVPLLVSNLTGCAREAWRAQDLGLTAEVLRSLLYMITTVSPGAKKGSTAPYASSSAVILELGRMQPRSLSEAFGDPIPDTRGREERALMALAKRAQQADLFYGHGDVQRTIGGVIDTMAAADALRAQSCVSIEGLAAWVGESLRAEKPRAEGS